ncbi:MAG: hypothetical protein FWF15_05455 [Oscillospiraceae bacterium]|nr:hypothetical protein [Oscillospiraceae bacterium]
MKNQVEEIFDTLKIPYKYKLFKNDPPKVPFAVWFIETETFTGSDNEWRLKDSDYTIELYTSEKDFALEEQLENLLPATEFEKIEFYITSQSLFCMTYKFKIITKRRMK